MVDNPAFHNPLTKKDSYLSAIQSAGERAKDEGSNAAGTPVNIDFRPVTLTVQAFYRQVSDVHVCQ